MAKQKQSKKQKEKEASASVKPKLHHFLEQRLKDIRQEAEKGDTVLDFHNGYSIRLKGHADLVVEKTTTVKEKQEDS